jgi:major membrane immunogen (membrane-anchored lipoprotein)
MFRHKILWLTLITGFLLFSGCSSSSDDDKTNNPETNTTEECNLTTHELFGNQCLEKCETDQERDEDGTCVIVDPNTTPECDLTTHEIVNEQCLEKCEADQERGENGVCETRTVAKILKSLYLQGVAIDGYLQDSNGTLKCGEKETSFVTAKNGFYEAKFEDLDENATLEICIIEVSGGKDVSTGKPFEGTISNIAEENSFGVSIYEEETIKPTPTLKEPVFVTPLTTFVTNTVVEASKKGETISKAEAEEQVSQSLGITTKALKSNPVAVLDDNTSTDEEKEEVAKAVKQTFIIQKLTESLSKSTLTDTADTTEKEIQFKQAYSAVISALSKKMENNSSLDLNKVLEEDVIDLPKKLL